MNTDAVIALFGGVRPTARLCGLSATSVHRWRKRQSIPRQRLITLALLAEEQGKASRRDFFPADYASIWPELKAD